MPSCHQRTPSNESIDTSRLWKLYGEVALIRMSRTELATHPSGWRRGGSTRRSCDGCQNMPPSKWVYSCGFRRRLKHYVYILRAHQVAVLYDISNYKSFKKNVQSSFPRYHGALLLTPESPRHCIQSYVLLAFIHRVARRSYMLQCRSNRGKSCFSR